MKLTQLAQELDVPDQDPLVVERLGRSFSAKYTPGGKNTPPSLRITTSVDETEELLGAHHSTDRAHVDTRPAIILRREMWLDRLGKRLGLNREAQVGDPSFDALVYVETDSPEQDVQRTLADDRLRNSDSLRRVAMLSVAAAMFLPVGLYSSLCWANRELDASPSVDHAARVTRVWTTRNKSTTYYHVDVTSWRPAEATRSLAVSQSFASKVRAGSDLVVTTRAGKFGWEWIDGFRAAQ